MLLLSSIFLPKKYPRTIQAKTKILRQKPTLINKILASKPKHIPINLATVFSYEIQKHFLKHIGMTPLFASIKIVNQDFDLGDL